MIYTDMTKKAINIMFEAHKNQKDKSNTPYVFHPWSIAEKMTNEIETTTALLHDVAEDSTITIKDLEKEFPKEVIDALKLLTHDENIGYYEYIKQISTNELATKVKLQDLKHNSNTDRLNKITKEDEERNKRYKKCIEYLELKQKMNNL